MTSALQSGAITFDNVSFAYREDRLVLQDITLDVPSRGFVALVGHTGSGKSTLASLMMGYYPLTQAKSASTVVRSLLSATARCVKASRWCSRIRWCWRIPSTPTSRWVGTIAGAGLGSAGNGAAGRAGARVERRDLYQLGEQGNNLSVGQKQLLALARVLVETPQVLILDEATASIDSGTEQAIQQALAAVREHTTLVVIAHRLSTIVEADTILVLHRGRPLSAVRTAAAGGKGRYWQMYQLQLAGEELAASA
jgi:ATP-binding cassette subfamily B multidrug efflux pump